MPTPPIIAVLSTHRHPRLRYVLKEMRNDLGWEFRLLTDFEQWAALPAAGKITYGAAGEEVDHLPLSAHSFVQGSAPAEEDLRVEQRAGLPVFFTVGKEVDYFAMIFFALSRYEEYGPFPADDHNRFPAAASHALANDYLHRPVVREWTAYLARQLRARFPTLPTPPTKPFRFRPTYDVDLLWAWQHRGLRGFGAGLRDLMTGHFRRGLRRFFTGPAQDPYFCIDYLENLHRKYDLQPLWFWLVADRKNRHDPNSFPIPPAQQVLIRQLSQSYTCGVHPSYASSERTELINAEADRLARITGRSVRHSRQHFLRFRLPATFRALRLAGITHDYSMGYADATGWRAGTNLPFMWYDLEREEATGLLVHPFAAMDATLKNYLNLSPQEAQAQISNLAAAVAPLGGDFMLLWHNSSFAEAYGWAGWREMYEQLCAALASGEQAK